MGRFGDTYRKLLEESIHISGNPKIQIIAVSKTQPFSVLKEAFEEGIRDFGENSIREGLVKIQGFHAALPDFPTSGPRFHHIGPLQTGTLRKLFGNFASTQGVGSLNALKELLKRSEKEKSRLEYCIQLNLTGEESKHGFAIQEFYQLLETLKERETSQLRLCGLMTMGPSSGDPIETRKVFKTLRKIRDEINTSWKLSMGMSGDYRIALEEGADILRIGSAIFGERL